jgi:large subunit ribosomal protein L10
MARPEKIARVEETKKRFTGNQVVFLTDFTGLSVDEINNLRFSLRDKGADYRVLKNTLTQLAIKGTDFEPLGELMVGPIAAAFTSEDPMVVAKELVSYAKENPNLKIRGAFIEGKVLNAASVRSLATLPSSEVLMARMVGAFRSPFYRLHNVLSGPYRGLVYALQALADSKTEAA